MISAIRRSRVLGASEVHEPATIRDHDRRAKVAAENDADHDDGDVPDHAVHRAKRFDALHLYFDVLRHHGRSHYSTPSREDGLARANREEEARLLLS